MTTSAIEQEAVERGGRSSFTPTYGYYRQPNGWITVSPMTGLEELKYRREGWVPLPQYGQVEMNSEYAADRPLEQLFMFGGAHELCEEQIRQTGLYLDPPLVPTCKTALCQDHKRHGPGCWARSRPVVFPQLENMTDLGPFACGMCGIEKPTVEARNQHESVAHKEEKSDIRTGEVLAQALVKGLAGNAAPQADSTVAQGELAELRLHVQVHERADLILR